MLSLAPLATSCSSSMPLLEPSVFPMVSNKFFWTPWLLTSPSTASLSAIMFASPFCISRTCLARTMRLLPLVESLVVSYLKTWMVPAAKLFLWSSEFRVAVKFVVACRIPEVMLDTRSWSYVRRGPVKSEGGIEERKEDWVI
jgi:hypothetical protein